MRGRAKIADLGLAVFVGASSLSKTASGTMGYIAPEAYGDEAQGHGRLTATVDIYALAATAIKLATGRDPFGTNPREIIKNQEAGRPVTTGLTEQQIAAVLSALHPDPKQRRFQTATEFVAAFAGRQNVVNDGKAATSSMSAWAQTLLGRGITCGEQDDASGAVAYYTAVIELPDAPVEQVAMALRYRGITHGKQGNVTGEISDYTAVIELPDAPVERVAKALLCRGIAHGRQGDFAGEITDYTAVIELPDAPVELVAWALRNRGFTHGEQGNVTGEISDYTAVIELPDAPVELVAWALRYRGITHGEQGNVTGAIADYTAVIELPDAPIDFKNRATDERNRLSS